MRAAAIVLALTLTACGGSGGGKNDDHVGGEEKLTDSISCTALVPSLDKNGDHDPVRGFHVKLISFLYSKGSVAATLEYTYKFNEKDSYTETASKVFPQSEKKHKIDSELLLVKFDPRSKEMAVYKKYLLGDSFEGECI